MPTLETLLSAADKQRLDAAQPKRFSCRSYAEPLSLAEWSAISYAAGRYRMPQVRLILTRVDEALFAPSMAGQGQITGCTAVAAVVMENTALRGRVYAGVLGEAFCLEAAAQGLATCWVTESYRERMLALPLRPYETLVALIAVGHAAQQAARRPAEELARYCDGDPASWPDALRQAALNLTYAPAKNGLRPWRIAYERESLCIRLNDHHSLDTGIAALHIELALTQPHTWRYARGAWEDAARAELK